MPIDVKSAQKKKMAGFECEFVEQPPEVLQTDCPLCLLVLREPYQATCCGKSFCKECIDKAEDSSPSCPTCKEEDDFVCYPNKGLQLSLYDFRVYCTNKSKGCDWTGKLRELDDHLNLNPPADKSLKGCPFEVIKCPLSYAGCEEKLPRQDIDDHLSEQTVGHMLMQTKKHCSEMRSLCQELQVVKGRKQHLEQCVSELKDEVRELKEEVKDLKEARQLETCTGQPIGHVEFTMTNFEQHKKENSPWYSPPFYTHPHGYKMGLSVYPNGQGDAVGTHASVFVHLLRGEFDEHLKWPFQGNITITMMDQDEDRRHFTRMVSFTDQIPLIHRQKVTQSCHGMNQGFGVPSFLPLINLVPHYLKNDSLKLRILRIELK